MLSKLTVAACLAASSAFAAGLEVTNVTVGRNLQTSASIKLTDPAPDAGLKITVTSSDPARLRLSMRPEAPGTDSLVLELRSGFDQTPEFWLQGLADKGEAVYTATAPGFTAGKGTVTLTPSAIAIVGPFRAPKFNTTVHGEPGNITLYSVRLDPALKVAQQQLIAGKPLTLDIKSSDAAAGVISASRVTLAAGSSTVVTQFKPAASGTTTLSIDQPPGFTVPAEHANVVAVVRTPGIVLATDVMIGENLQIAGVVGLGELAGAGGVDVTVTSDDPSKLLLSHTESEVGAKSITVHIKEGGFSDRMYLQALGKSGTVTYSASAKGFISRIGKVMLAPSGIVMTPSHDGPPDEAEVLRKEGGAGSSAFVAHLSKGKPMPISVWTAHLDPTTLRSADITVQPLRAGMSIKVLVQNQDPSVGEMTTSVVINGGSEHGVAQFTPLKVGNTVLTAVTPEGFTKSANSTTVKAVVKE